MEDEAIGTFVSTDHLATVASSYAREGSFRNRCMTTHMLTTILTVQHSWKSADIPADAEFHVDAMIALAQRGFVPKLFWWTTPEVFAILDGARSVVHDVGVRADAAMASATRLLDDL